MNRWLQMVSLIVLVALLAGCSGSDPRVERAGASGTARPTETQTSSATSAVPSATPATVRSSADVQRITPAEAKALLDAGQAVLYDARSAESYASQHAAGAISFPEEDVEARFGELPTDKTLIFYCT